MGTQQASPPPTTTTTTTTASKMTRRDSEVSSDASVHPESTTSSPGLSRSSTEPAHRERRNSRLGQAMDHIRQALSQEQERLFGPHRIAQQRRQYQSKVGEHLEHLREQDKIDRARAEAEMAWEDNDNNGASPAVQAQNRERQKSWGWPGLGTFPEAPKDPAKTRRMSVSPERAAELEHK